MTSSFLPSKRAIRAVHSDGGALGVVRGGGWKGVIEVQTWARRKVCDGSSDYAVIYVCIYLCTSPTLRDGRSVTWRSFLRHPYVLSDTYKKRLSRSSLCYVHIYLRITLNWVISRYVFPGRQRRKGLFKWPCRVIFFDILHEFFKIIPPPPSACELRSQIFDIGRQTLHHILHFYSRDIFLLYNRMGVRCENNVFIFKCVSQYYW